MARELYNIIECNGQERMADYLQYFRTREDALNYAKERANILGKGKSVILYVICPPADDEPGNPCYHAIYDSTEHREMLGLSDKQREAVNAIFDAVQKAQDLGVFLLIGECGDTFAFNTNHVEAWSTDENNDREEISLHDLYFVGDTIAEPLYDTRSIFVEFRD